MHAAATTPVTYFEYLERERLAAERHEFYHGVIYAMAGGTPEHGFVAANMIYELRRLLGSRPCVVATSDVRVRVVATGLSTYPDVSVVCGPVERALDDAHAITNPLLLVEVLSPSTEAYDRGEKFAHYRRIPSLREVVLVSTHEHRIEAFQRGDDGRWVLNEATAGQALTLVSLGGTLEVDDVYRNVVLAPA